MVNIVCIAYVYDDMCLKLQSYYVVEKMVLWMFHNINLYVLRSKNISVKSEINKI